MRLPPRSLVIAASLAALFLFSSCDGGGGAATPPADITPSPTAGAGETPTSIDAPVIDLATAQPMTTVYAVGTGDLLSDQPGLAVGDVNGDGIADVVVGARFADPADRADAGAAYLIFGSRSPPQSVDLGEDEQNVTIIGAMPGDNLGFSAAAADLNGDGVDDVVLGALSASPPESPATKTGAVYIIFGGPNLPASLDLSEAEADVTMFGLTPNGFFGDSLASGDVNGDGTADLLIGATFGAHAGEDGAPVPGGGAYVLFGRERWPADMSPDDADVTVQGAEEFDELGDFVVSGDLNGDGFDDIIATAEAADGPDDDRDTTGEVHVVFGRSDISGEFDIARGEQDLSVYGAETQDTLGFSLATGDLDGDGMQDLIMGARLGNGPDDSTSRAGHVYVLFGGKKLPLSVDLAKPPDSIVAIYGRSQSEFLGTSETAADLDGDGASELIMGTIFGDAPSRLDSGAVYIAKAPRQRSAGPSGFISVSAVPLRTVIYGAAESEHMGSPVLTGDMDGDGALELITVAADGDGPTSERPGVGRVYVIPLGG